MAYGPAHVLVLAGGILAYHTITDTWTEIGALPSDAPAGSGCLDGKSLFLLDASGRAYRGEAVFPLFMAQRLPRGACGLVVAGLFSASMSTLSGGMNSIATALVTDFYRRFRPEAPDSRCLRLAVMITAALGIASTAAAALLAAIDLRSAWDAFLQILGLFGGSIAGLFALGIFTRRAHGGGALVGAVAGAAATFAVQSLTPVSFFLYAGTGIVACFAAGYLASFILPSRPRDLVGLTLYTMMPE